MCATDTDAVVRYRNDVVHGGGAPAGGVDQALADVLGWLNFFALAARSGIPVGLVVAGGMTFNGVSYDLNTSALIGAARSVASARTEVAAPLVTGRVYLRAGNGYVDMWPMIVAEGSSTGDWNVTIVDGFDQARRGEVSAKDRLKYVDCGTGARLTSQVRVLGELYGGAAG